MTAKKQQTAAFIIIGNEILSGRTPDQNLNFLAVELNKLGINFAEARFVCDDEEQIIGAVNELRYKYDYVFTSGGIGPTHDDITALSIAKAFGVELYRDAKAVRLLEEHYEKTDKELNAARLKMADLPEGSTLLNNPISAAPGFKIENVFVMAGVPAIMKAMVKAAEEHLNAGPQKKSHTISTYITEGDLAEPLANIQYRHPDIEIGSYPFIRGDKLGTSLVFRGLDEQQINEATKLLRKFIAEHGAQIIQDIDN